MSNPRKSRPRKKASTFPDSYESKADGHVVDARESTKADVAAGRAGNVGDFIVARPGFSAQWWTRAAFLDAYELSTSRPAKE